MVHFVIQAIAFWYFTALIYFGWQHYEKWRTRDSRIKKNIALFSVLAWATAGSSAYLIYRIMSRRQSDDTAEAAEADTVFFIGLTSELAHRCFRAVLGLAMISMAVLRIYRRA